MTENTTKPRSRKPPRQAPGRSPIESAPRQPLATEAWKEFADRLVGALVALEEDEFLVIRVKGTNRYLQFMDQGNYGMRVETVSDYYLPEDDHLREEDYLLLMKLGWHAPTQVPGTSVEDIDGSPNYHLDLARPLPLQDVAMMAVMTLVHVHRAGHPGRLEYDARSIEGMSIRFPHLLIRRRAEETSA
jgi:hypothetical protein